MGILGSRSFTLMGGERLSPSPMAFEPAAGAVAAPDDDPLAGRPILSMLNQNQSALAGMSEALLTGRGGFGAGVAGFQRGAALDRSRMKESRDEAERLARVRALDGMFAELERQGKMTPAHRALAGAYPELAAKWAFDQAGGQNIERWEPATVGGVPGQRNTATGRFDPFPQPAPRTNFDDEAKLRMAFENRSKEFLAVRDAYGRVQAAVVDETGASDVALVYGFMKMLDPGSVVREGEFATAEQTAGLPDQLVALYNRLVNGERLPPAARAGMLQQATRQFEAAQARHAEDERQFRGLAQAYEMDPARIVTDMGGGVTPSDGTAQAIAAAREAIRQGKDPEAVRQRLREYGIEPPGDL